MLSMDGWSRFFHWSLQFFQFPFQASRDSFKHTNFNWYPHHIFQFFLFFCKIQVFVSVFTSFLFSLSGPIERQNPEVDEIFFYC